MSGHCKLPSQSIIFFIFWLLFNSTCFADQVNTSLNIGYERITSPIVRVQPNSPALLIDGKSKLDAYFYQVNLNVLNDWAINDDLNFDISTNASLKKAKDAETLNYGNFSVDGSWRKKFENNTLSIGPSIQRIWIQNENFRDSASLQSDLTNLKPDGGFTDVYLALSKNYFVKDYSFFDSNSLTTSLTQHNVDIASGFNALDWQLSISREKNARNFDDLSNYSYFGRVSVDKKLFDLTWSLGMSMTKSYFDKPLIVGLDKRKDRYINYEVSVERNISDSLNFAIELAKAKNNSNIAFYRSDYVSFSLSLFYNY